MHRRHLIVTAIRLLTVCVLAAILSGAPAVARLAPLVKTASWGSDQPASDRLGDASPAEHESIRIGEACEYESAPGRTAWLSRDPIEEDGGVNLYGYVNNDPANLRDALGLEPNLNLFPPGSEIYNNAQKMKPNGTCYMVTAHGTSKQVYGPDNTTVSPTELASKIKNDPTYKPGTPVTLLSCHGGDTPDGYGQKLSDALQAPVNASSDYTWFYPNGTVTVNPAKSGNMANGPDNSKPGKMIPFTPQKP